MTRFFTLVHGETGVSMSMRSIEGSLDYAKVQVEEIKQRVGKNLIYIHLLESVWTESNGRKFVEIK